MREKLKKIVSGLFGERGFRFFKFVDCFFRDYRNIYYSQFGEDVSLRVLRGGEREKRLLCRYWSIPPQAFI